MHVFITMYGKTYCNLPNANCKTTKVATKLMKIVLFCTRFELNVPQVTNIKAKVDTKLIKNTLCIRAGETYANYLDFCKNHQFHVIYCVTLTYVLYFEEFLTHDSR